MMTVCLGNKWKCPDSKYGIITDMIVYYDFPRYFIVLSESGNRYVFYQYNDETGFEYDEWLVGEISHSTYYKLIQNKITLYDSFDLMELMFVKDDYDKFYEHISINRTDIDDDVLPVKSTYFDL